MSARLTAAIALFAGVLMVLSIACDRAPTSLATPATGNPTVAVGDPDALREAQTKLDKHRALWEANRAADYWFELEHMCFCPPGLLDPVRISVVNGVVVSVIYLESGKAPEHDGFGRYVTIDGLFDTIQEAIYEKAWQITIKYDPEIGYPTDASFDYVGNQTDDTESFTASGYSTEAPEPVAATGKVTGTITYRERMTLRPNATVEVELRDVSLQDAPSITVARVTITDPGQVPIEFAIEYDPSAIDDRSTYAVQATISDWGRILFTNTTAYDVITGGNPTHVDIVLQRVSPESPGPESGMTEVPARIESVDVSYESSAGYALAIVSGLPSGCAKFGGYDVERRGKVIDVTVTSLVPAGPVACAAIYRIHGGEVDLGTDLEVGATYTVVVNGQVTNAFVARDPKWFLASVVDSPIRSVEVDVLESSPPQYEVSVVSTLPLGSSCSTFNGYDIDRRGGNEIHVTVTHLEVLQKNLSCTRDLPAVNTQVPLGSDFTPGKEYTVVVNGVTTTLVAQ